MKAFFSGLLLLSLTGCVTQVTIPEGHGQTPEVPGAKFSGSIGLMPVLSRRIVYAIPDSVKGSTSVTTKSTFLGSNTLDNMLADALFPLHGSIDFLERFSVFANNSGGGAQWQFLGKTAQKTKQGNFAASLVFNGYGRGKSNDRIELGMNTSTLNGSIVTQAEVYALVFGYRFADEVGLGLNVFAQPIHAWGNGYIDGGSVKTNVGAETVDYGIGLQLYGGSPHFQFLFSPSMVLVQEPVRGQTFSTAFLTFRLSYLF